MRYWTVDEARAYLPRLRELVERVRDAATRAAEVRGDGRQAPFVPGVKEAVDELAAGDILLRDPVSGLCDLHARGSDGVVYYLCWRLEEPELCWWHLPEEGFPGRKPLPREPE